MGFTCPPLASDMRPLLPPMSPGHQPTSISGCQWGPRDPLTPSRTPLGVGPPLAGRELHSHARAGPALEPSADHCLVRGKQSMGGWSCCIPCV
eukprot:scaffold260989_cov32-Tisochrysis_lutea.AAC.2